MSSNRLPKRQRPVSKMAISFTVQFSGKRTELLVVLQGRDQEVEHLSGGVRGFFALRFGVFLRIREMDARIFLIFPSLDGLRAFALFAGPLEAGPASFFSDRRGTLLDRNQSRKSLRFFFSALLVSRRTKKHVMVIVGLADYGKQILQGDQMPGHLPSVQHRSLAKNQGAERLVREPSWGL